MRKPAIYLAIIAFCVISSSCSTIMMKINGVTHPKFVTEKQAQKFLGKKRTKDPCSTLFCKDSASILHLIVMLKSLPGINFFNRQGDLLVYGDYDCPGTAMDFARSLRQNSVNRINPSCKFGDIMKLVKPADNYLILPISGFDYTVVLYWAMFIGNINKNVFEIADELKKKSSLKIQIVYVNVDFQKSWGMKRIPTINVK